MTPNFLVKRTLAIMTADERWALLIALDDELLRGGVILSEWCAFIVREADTAFANGAHLPPSSQPCPRSKRTCGQNTPPPGRNAWWN